MKTFAIVLGVLFLAEVALAKDRTYKSCWDPKRYNANKNIAGINFSGCSDVSTTKDGSTNIRSCGADCCMRVFSAASSSKGIVSSAVIFNSETVRAA
jgi:WD40 repeat protein